MATEYNVQDNINELEKCIKRNFYSTNIPTVGELVLTIFTENKDGYFEAELVEYPYSGIMSYQDATKKKKMENWGKIVPLNKQMVVKVDEVDKQNKSTRLSLTQLDGTEFGSSKSDDIQSSLLKHFSENTQLKNLVKSICINHNFNMVDVWENLISKIDELRREEDLNISIFEFFTNLIDTNEIKNIIDDLDEDIMDWQDFHKKLLLVKKNEKYKYQTKIQMISLDGIIVLKEFIGKIKCDYDYTLTYESSPNYVLETTEDKHSEFIKQLMEIKKDYPNIFIKNEKTTKFIYN
jgi:translation initiation factor 2 alpha subunit (eIF-2alpha)